MRYNKQQSAGRHIAPFGHIILILAKQSVLIYEIGICFFFAMHTSLRNKHTDLLARTPIQDSVSEWSDIKIHLSVLVQRGHLHNHIEM